MDEDEELALSDPEDDDLLEAADVKATSAAPRIPYNGGLMPSPSSFVSKEELPESSLVNPSVSANGQAVIASTAPSSQNVAPSAKTADLGGSGDEAVSESRGLTGGLAGGIGDETLQKALQKALADLAAERVARQAAEKARASSDEAKTAAFARFKILAQEAVKQKDEANRQRDEAQSVVDGLWKAKEDAMKARDAAKNEMEQAAVVLSAEADRIVTRVTGQERRPTDGGGVAPRTAGLAAIVHVLKKRLDSAVEEVIRQRDVAREEAEQRNLESAIEMSQLESTISALKEESGKKSEEIERWKDAIAAKDERLGDVLMQLEGLEGKCKRLEMVLASEKKRGDDAESKAKIIDGELRKLKAGSEEYKRAGEEARQRVRDMSHVMMELQSKLAAMESSRKKVEEDVKREREDREGVEREKEIVQDEGRRMLEQVDSLLQQRKESKREWVEEKEILTQQSEQLSVAKQQLVQELSALKNEFEDSQNTVRDLQTRAVSRDEEVDRLESLLHDLQSGEHSRRAESEVEKANLIAKDAIVQMEVQVNARREAERARRQAEEAASQEQHARKAAEKSQEAAIVQAAAAAAETEAVRMRFEASDRELRAARKEVDDLHSIVRSLEKAVADEKAVCKEVEAREGVALQEVHRLQELLSDMEEEAARWRAAASEEAAAGAAVVEELEATHQQIAILQNEVLSWKRTAEEVAVRIKTKEEMARAAMAARDTAEKSLQIADRRTLELRRRLEEMASQMDATGNGREGSGGRQGGRVGEREGATEGERELQVGCWSAAWPWLHSSTRPIFPVTGMGRNRGSTQMTAEMEELTEPLM